jgi:predicted amidohydrolase
MTSATAVLAQLAPKPRDPAENAQTLADVVRAHPGADLVVTPELFLTGYDMPVVRQLALEVDGPEIARVRDAAAAAGTAVAVGFAESRGARPANSLALIDTSGAVAAVYRKIQLFGSEIDDFEVGDRLVVTELAGRLVGPMICFDVEFPEVARALARSGAELLVTASANMSPFFGDHLLATRARALDNRLPHLYANRVGSEGGYEFVGGSRAIAPDGTVHAEAPDTDEHLLAVTIPASTDTDERVDYLGHLPGSVPVECLGATST